MKNEEKQKNNSIKQYYKKRKKQMNFNNQFNQLNELNQKQTTKGIRCQSVISGSVMPLNTNSMR